MPASLHLSSGFLLAVGLTLTINPASSAADDEWASLPNGIQGQRAQFDGAGGVKRLQAEGLLEKPAS
jgi:hypothetical protein